MKMTCILMAFSIGFSCCNNNNPQKRELESMNEGRLLNEHFFFSVPYRQTSDSAAVISVVIDGKKRRFMIDTGAPLSVSKALQEEMGFEVLQDMQLRDANGDSTNVKIVRVKHLAMGPLQIADVPALVLDFSSPLFACDTLDGLIGSNLLRMMIVQFNKPERRIYFGDDIDSFRLNSLATSIDMYLNSMQSDPTVPVHIGAGVTDTVLYDSGDGHLYNLSKPRFDAFNKNGALAHTILRKGTGVGSQGILASNTDTLPSMQVKIDSFRLGNSFIKNVVAPQQIDNHSRMGRGLWDYGVVTMDYLKRKFYFSPFSKSSVYREKRDFGFLYQERNGKLVVTVVWEGTQAFECGMKAGDEIVRFGDFIPASVSKCDWYTYTEREIRTESLNLKYKTGNSEVRQCVLHKIFLDCPGLHVSRHADRCARTTQSRRAI